MTAKTMAEVMMNHPWLPDHEGLYTGLCPSCPGVKIHGGHNSPSHAAHLEAALAAAGFGLVADAVVIHVAHDTEAHARSFNEGYETAIAQGLADDPSLAQDWLDAKLAEAGAKALEDAADELTWVRPESACEDTEACCGSADSCDLMRPSSYAVGADWLRARAAAVRGEDAHD